MMRTINLLHVSSNVIIFWYETNLNPQNKRRDTRGCMSGSERFTTMATIPTTTTGTTDHALLQARSSTAHQIDAVA